MITLGSVEVGDKVGKPLPTVVKLGLVRKLNLSFKPVPVNGSAWAVDAKEPKFGVKEDPATDWLIIGEPVTELATTVEPAR